MADLWSKLARLQQAFSNYGKKIGNRVKSLQRISKTDLIINSCVVFFRIIVSFSNGEIWPALLKFAAILVGQFFKRSKIQKNQHSRTKCDSDVGDKVILVILWWWSIQDVADRIIMLATFSGMLVFFQCTKSVTNILNLSPTHFVFIIRHQYRCHWTKWFKNLLNTTFYGLDSIKWLHFNWFSAI